MSDPLAEQRFRHNEPEIVRVPKLNAVAAQAFAGGGSVTVDWGDIGGLLADQTDLQAALDGKAPIVHTHIIGDVTGLQAALDGKAALAHTHIIGDVTGLQAALDGKAALVHTHAAADITSGTLAAARMPAYTGDVTSAVGTVANTIANNAVTLAKMADMATASFIGRDSASTGDPEILNATRATALLNNFTTALKGLAPPSGGGTTNFLRADGTWAAPPGGGSAAWGGITGTLSDQTDLQTALDGKAPTVHTHAAGDITSGTLAAARMPAYTGDVTSSAGTVANTIANNAVTLAKMADVATGTVFYRKTSGTGDPEVQTLATLKTDLGIATDLANYLPLAGGTLTGDLTVPDEAYGAGWNGDLTVPTKNAIYDKIDANDVLISGKANLAGGNSFTGNQSVTGDITATNITATGDISADDITTSGSINATGGLTSHAGTIVSQAAAAGNALYRIRNDTGANQGLLWWERSTDLITLQRYAADGATIEGKISLDAAATTFYIGTTLRMTLSATGINVVGGITASGDITIATGSLIPNLQTVATTATLTATFTQDVITVTALAGNMTIAAPTGTAIDGKRLTYRIKDNGTARTLTWNAIFRAFTAALPTPTVANKWMYVTVVYNLNNTRWDVIHVAKEV